MALTYSLFDVGACNCGSTPCLVTVCVTGCFAAVTGAGLPITCSSGASCTTGPANCCTLTLPGPGTYTFTATDANGDTASVTQAVTCGSTVSIGFTGWGFCLNSTAALNCTLAWSVPSLSQSGTNTFTLTWNPVLFGATGGWDGATRYSTFGIVYEVQIPAAFCFVQYSPCSGTPFSAISVVTTASCTPMDFVGNTSDTSVCGVFGFDVTGTVTITP